MDIYKEAEHSLTVLGDRFKELAGLNIQPQYKAFEFLMSEANNRIGEITGLSEAVRRMKEPLEGLDKTVMAHNSFPQFAEAGKQLLAASQMKLSSPIFEQCTGLESPFVALSRSLRMSSLGLQESMQQTLSAYDYSSILKDIQLEYPELSFGAHRFWTEEFDRAYSAKKVDATRRQDSVTVTKTEESGGEGDVFVANAESIAEITNLRIYEESQLLELFLPVILGSGLSLYRFLRKETVADLLAARSCDHSKILLRDKEKILDDCVSLYGDCDDLRPSSGQEVLQDLHFVKLAVAAFREGHLEAAQSLVATILDHAVSRMKAVNERLECVTSLHRWNDPRDASSFLLKRSNKSGEISSLLLIPISVAFQRWDQGNPPKNPLFNRHACAHDCFLEQYSDRNFLQAVILVCDLLCFEMDYGFAALELEAKKGELNIQK